MAKQKVPWQAILILTTSIAFLTFRNIQTRKNKLYQITFATRPHPVLTRLVDRVHSFGEDIHVLGLQENRDIGWRSGKRNFGIKLRELATFIQNPFLQPNDILLVSDAYDVAMIRPQHEIRRRYEALFTKPIVFGAESNCHPDANLAVQYGYHSPSELFPFLNSGLFIGRVWAIQECMKGYQYKDEESDQHYWTKQYLKRRDLIELDTGAKLFLNCHNIGQKDIVYDTYTESVYFKPYGTYPLFVHANGTDRSYLYPILGRWTEPAIKKIENSFSDSTDNDNETKF